MEKTGATHVHYFDLSVHSHPWGIIQPLHLRHYVYVLNSYYYTIYSSYQPCICKSLTHSFLFIVQHNNYTESGPGTRQTIDSDYLFISAFPRFAGSTSYIKYLLKVLRFLSRPVQISWRGLGMCSAPLWGSASAYADHEWWINILKAPDICPDILNR